MSFHNTAPCFLTFFVVINPYSLFKFKIFVLNTSLFTFHATLCSWYDYVQLQHSRTGANNCTGANYCKALIVVDVDVCISSHLKEELTWAVDKWFQVTSTIMLFIKQ